MPHVKTVRFAHVVAAAGKPLLHLTWLPPAKDPALARAAKAHRLLTLHQTLRGARKDYGTIGLHADDKAQFLIFPKSLAAFEDRRVIAIDYTAFAGETVAADALRPARAPKAAPGKRALPAGSSARAAPRRDAPPPAAAPQEAPREAPTARGEIEKAIAELKAKKPRAALTRLQAWLKIFADE